MCRQAIVARVIDLLILEVRSKKKNTTKKYKYIFREQHAIYKSGVAIKAQKPFIYLH